MKQTWISLVVAGFIAGSTVAQAAPVANRPSGGGLSREAAGASFLTRIRYADPDYRLILMACLKENELNLLLSRHATTEDIPILVQGLLDQLRRQFPGEHVSVVAFRPVVPLREAGVARLDARTGRVTYTSGPALPSAARP